MEEKKTQKLRSFHLIKSLKELPLLILWNSQLNIHNSMSKTKLS